MLIDVIHFSDDDPEFNSEKLMMTILMFIHKLMSSQYFYDLNIPDFALLDYEWFYLQDNYVPPDALYQLIMLLKITDTQVLQWNNNVNDFVEEEELEIIVHEEADRIRKTTEDLIDVSICRLHMVEPIRNI